MNKKQMRISGAAILLGAMCLTGCAPQVNTSVPNTIQVETVGAGPTITVPAREIVKVVPDMAVVVYGVNTENRDAGVCQQENSRKVDQVLEYLKGQGIQESSIATSDFSLDPMYDWSSNRRILTGYEMRTQITVSDIPMEQTGALISHVVDAGANEILSVSYLCSKYDEAYQEALARAVKQAKVKAEAMAHAEGCQVLDVVSMEEFSDMQQGRYVDSGMRNASYKAAAEDAVVNMAVMAGEMEVSAKIQVVYRLAPK